MTQEQQSSKRQFDFSVTETDTTQAPCWLLLFLL